MKEALDAAKKAQARLGGIFRARDCSAPLTVQWFPSISVVMVFLKGSVMRMIAL